jgi:predicted phage-related endonuclease
MITAADDRRTARSNFLAERRTMIGGSDAAAAMNIGYGCRRRLVMDKRGVIPDYEDEETAAMERGREMEALIADKYARATNRVVRVVGTQRHNYYEFLGVHMDRRVEEVSGQGGLVRPGYLEIKCVGRESFHRIKRDGIPEDYILQVQHGLMVTGWQWGSYAVFWPDGWQLLWWDVERDDVLIRNLMDAEIRTWAMVQSGEMPERLAPGDRRCAKCCYRKSCQGSALLALIDDAPGEFEDDPSLEQLAKEYADAQRIEAEARELKESLGAQLKSALGDRQAVRANGTRITYRATYRKGYTVAPSTVRSLRVYPA